MKRLFQGITVALVVLGATLSGSQSSLAVTQVDTGRFFVDPGSLPFNALAGTSTTRYWGISSHGAGWQIEVPDNWKGDLVLYAHGYAGTGARPRSALAETPTHRSSKTHREGQADTIG